MTRREPSDNANRLAVASRIDLNHFVEAGAGTGKTDTLLKRVVGLVTARTGRVPMRNIAAITFTERAAEELRGRIRERLHSLDGEREALLQVDEAAIGTIHSFARRILAQHGLAIGVPPGFVVASNSAVDRGKAETWHRVHEAWQADPQCRQHLEALSVLGIRESALHDLVFEMRYVRSRMGATALHPAGRDVADAAADLGSMIRGIRANATRDCSSKSDRLYQAIWGEKFDALLGLADALAAGTAPDDAARDVALAGPKMRFGNVGSASNWGGRAPKEIRDSLKEDMERGCNAVASAAVDIPVRGLLAVASKLFEGEEQQRIRAGELQFDDLLVLCHRLLATHPAVAARVADAYRVIMVDEFQDTDPLQWEIVRLITSSGCGDGRPRPGSLVLVGDPKQSIYGFRGADVATYEDVREQFSGESRQGLSVNFRTVKPVVEWVNRLYSTMFGATPRQVGYEALSAHHGPEHPEAGPPVLLLRSDAEGASGQEEASLVVAAIDRALREEWMVTAQDAQTWNRVYERPATFRDIAVLVPVRTTVGLLLNELDSAGIPYRSNDVSIVFYRPITRGLTSALRAIARQDDQLEVWGALKSPLFGLDDQMLLDHARSAGAGAWRIPSRDATAPDQGSVAAALGVLREALGKASSGRPVDVLNFLVDRCDIPAVIAAQPRAAFEAECLRYLLDQAQAWQDAGGAGIEPFVAWLATASGDLKSGLGVSDDKLADAIQISTVHGAKGLEFPIVILAGMSSPPRNGVPPLLVGHDGAVEFTVTGKPPPVSLNVGELPPRSVKWHSPGYPDLAEQRMADEEAELQRLLYVAMTRAQDHLVVSTVGGTRSRSARLAEWLPEAEELRVADVVWIPAAVAQVASSPPRDHIDRAVLVASRPTLLRPSLEQDLASRLGIVVDAPGWEVPPAADPVSPEPPEPSPAGDVEGRRDGARSGTAMGNAVHEALERIVLQGPGADVARIVQETADANYADRTEAERRVRAALLSPTVQEAMVSRCWPELTFTYGIPDPDSDGVDVIDGVADLIYESGGRLVVADYKTDASPGEEARKHYAEQLSIYAKILTDVTGLEVARKVVVWLPPSGSARDIEV